MKWSFILDLIKQKIFGSSDRVKEFAQITKEWKGLYEEKKKLVTDYEDQIKKIERHRTKHPDNGVELDEWKDREHVWMLELVKAKEQISVWREMAIFLEHENESLKSKLDKK